MFSDDNNLNKLQHICLNILEIVAGICDKNNIVYYLCGGTLLGAVRERGFIPWDNDIDIAMPRSDYERFIAIAEKELPKNYKLEYYKQYQYPNIPNAHHVQVLDLKTKIIRKWTVNQKEINVWIDIFPLDGSPKNKIIRYLHYYHYRFWNLLMQLSWFDNNVNIERKNRSFFQTLILKIIQISKIGSKLNTIKIINHMEKIAKKYNYYNSDYLISFHGIRGKKEIFLRDYYNDRKKIIFEDKLFYAPVNYDSLLKHFYGNYKKRPETISQSVDYHSIEIVELNQKISEQ